MSRITVTQEVHFRNGGQGRKELQGGPLNPPASGRVPRVARLMALAIRQLQKFITLTIFS